METRGNSAAETLGNALSSPPCVCVHYTAARSQAPRNGIPQQTDHIKHGNGACWVFPADTATDLPVYLFHSVAVIVSTRADRLHALVRIANEQRTFQRRLCKSYPCGFARSHAYCRVQRDATLAEFQTATISLEGKMVLAPKMLEYSAPSSGTMLGTLLIYQVEDVPVFAPLEFSQSG